MLAAPERKLRDGRPARLVIVSVPFYRIARMSLSPIILHALRTHGDVAIVAPFAEEQGFRRNFGGPNTTFVAWTATPVGTVPRALLFFAEILRVNGYWRRFASRGMSYYLRNQCVRFGEDGRDARRGAAQRAAYWFLSWAGVWPRAWDVAERLAGVRWWRFPRLRDLAARYTHVTLVQSANWGIQDRALARLAANEGWRTVLLPYTTDQLDTNGYLLSRFDAVCVQGSYEFELARHVHRLPPSRISRLGSAWFRHLEAIRAKQGSGPAAPRAFVLYAGVASTYFPRASEFEAIDAIAKHLARRHPDVDLVYRPVEFDEGRRRQIEDRYAPGGRVSLQWPSATSLGLDEYKEVEQERSLREFVGGCRGCRVVVMSTNTSLAKDIAFLEGCGVIANLADGHGVLRRRGIGDLHSDAWPGAGIRVVTSIPELLENVDQFLADPRLGAEAARQIVDSWDYPEVDFVGTLHRAVYGEPPEGRAELSCAG